MAITVVDLLRNFIGQQAKLGGPFDSPDAFFGAMQEFIESKKARRVVADAWFERGIDLATRTRTLRSADDVFEILRKRSEQAVRVRIRKECSGITSNEQAIGIIVRHIDGAVGCTCGLQYQTFTSHHHMQATAERAIQVVATVLRFLPARVTDKLRASDCEKLQNIAERISFVSKPVPRKDLWMALTQIFPRIEKAFTGTSMAEQLAKPKMGWGTKR